MLKVQGSWTELQEHVEATFDQDEIDVDPDYLDRYERSLMLSASQKAQWKTHSKALLTEGIEPVLVDAILEGTFILQAAAA